MAHKKGVGSSDNGRDSNSNRLGVKLFGGESAIAGNIIVRQRGSKYHVGDNVYKGKDFTIHAKVDGTVQFSKKAKNKTVVNIVPMGVAVAAPKAPAKKAPVKKAPAAKAPAKKAVAKKAPATKEEE